MRKNIINKFLLTITLFIFLFSYLYGDIPQFILKYKDVNYKIENVGSWISIKNITMYIEKIYESKVAVDGPYSGNEYYTFSAEADMKFIIFIFRLENNYNRLQKTPSVDFGEIVTSKGNIYDCWSPSVGIHTEEFQPKKSTKEEIDYLIGSSGSYVSLYPGKDVKGCAVFYLPINEEIEKFKLANIKEYIIFNFTSK